MFDERSFLKGEEYTSTSSVVAVEHMEAMDMEEDDRRKEERRALPSNDERAERFILFVVWFMFLEKGQAGTWLPSLVWYRMGNGRAVGVGGEERSKCEAEKWWWFAEMGAGWSKESGRSFLCSSLRFPFFRAEISEFEDTEQKSPIACQARIQPFRLRLLSCK